MWGGLLSNERPSFGGMGGLLSRLIGGRLPCSNCGGCGLCATMCCLSCATTFGGTAAFTVGELPAKAAPEIPNTPAATSPANTFCFMFVISFLCICPTTHDAEGACVLLACGAEAAEVCAVPEQILCGAVLRASEAAEAACAGRDGACAAEAAEAGAVRRVRVRKLSLFRQALYLQRSPVDFRKTRFLLLQLLELLCTSLFSSFVCTSLLQR